MTSSLVSETQRIFELNEFIHASKLKGAYHMQHIKLLGDYARELNRRLDAGLDDEKLTYIGMAHDTFKERSLRPGLKVEWQGHDIPQSTNRYVRMNLDTLDKFGLGDYFNTDVQLHPLSAGIFLHNEFGIDDPEILYPIFFHSCPIIDIYKDLPERIQTMVDIIMLSDKLSSNYLRINVTSTPVRIDLDQLVFGDSGKEFNYSMGLLVARIISQGRHPDYQSSLTTAYYYDRLHNPLIPRKFIAKTLGGSKIWEPRESPLWKTP